MQESDKFEVKQSGTMTLWRFEKTSCGFVAICDEASLTVEGDDLGDTRRVAAEAVSLLVEDLEEEGETWEEYLKHVSNRDGVEHG